jgi:hypothetical protein
MGLINEFEASYKGNHLGVERLLRKRTRCGRAEYFVKWKGRPDRENS